MSLALAQPFDRRPYSSQVRIADKMVSGLVPESVAGALPFSSDVQYDLMMIPIVVIVKRTPTDWLSMKLSKPDEVPTKR